MLGNSDLCRRRPLDSLIQRIIWVGLIGPGINLIRAERQDWLEIIILQCARWGQGTEEYQAVPACNDTFGVIFFFGSFFGGEGAKIIRFVDSAIQLMLLCEQIGSPRASSPPCTSFSSKFFDVMNRLGCRRELALSWRIVFGRRIRGSCSFHVSRPESSENIVDPVFYYGVRGHQVDSHATCQFLFVLFLLLLWGCLQEIGRHRCSRVDVIILSQLYLCISSSAETDQI